MLISNNAVIHTNTKRENHTIRSVEPDQCTPDNKETPAKQLRTIMAAQHNRYTRQAIQHLDQGVSLLRRINPLDAKQLDQLYDQELARILSTETGAVQLAPMHSKPTEREPMDSMLSLMPGVVCLVVASSGVGKSWFALELCRAMATGSMLFGQFPIRKSKRCAYLDFEMGLDDLSDRMHRLCSGNNDAVPLTNFHLIDGQAQRLWLDDDASEDRLVAALNGIEVLVIDSLRQSTRGDENSSDDMSQVLSHIQQIARRVGCAVLVLHHTGKTGGDARGSSAITACVSNAIKLEVKDGRFRVSQLKYRDAKVEPFEYSLQDRGEVNDRTHKHHGIACVADVGRAPDKLTKIAIAWVNHVSQYGETSLAELAETYGPTRRNSRSDVVKLIAEEGMGNWRACGIGKAKSLYVAEAV
jgi:hypothetical protein